MRRGWVGGWVGGRLGRYIGSSTGGSKTHYMGTNVLEDPAGGEGDAHTFLDLRKRRGRRGSRRIIRPGCVGWVGGSGGGGGGGMSEGVHWRGGWTCMCTTYRADTPTLRE